ncbi:MAG TPA: component of SufBCD complex [Paracoccaceae bacterium]|nr:component of SufBCD complex [Paracoccaceae bacterium]
MDPLSILDTNSFWNIWYWIFTIVAWSLAAHWTIGVPFDMLVLADRKGGEHVENFEALVRINIVRLRYYFDNYGVLLIGVISFLLSALGVLAFFFNLEPAQALFMLVLPMTIMSGFSARFAFRVQKENWSGAILRKKMRHRRAWNQFIGLCGISAAAFVGALNYLSHFHW